MSEVEFFVDEAGGFRFRIKAGNGEIVASSEAYTTAADSVRGYHDLRCVMAGMEDEDDMRPGFTDPD